MERTYKFFEDTLVFYEKFQIVKNMLEQWGIDKNINEDSRHPLSIWANKIIEAMWLDCYLSTNPRNREIALFLAAEKDPHQNALLLPDNGEIVDFESAEKYFAELPKNLEKAIDNLFQTVAAVYLEIVRYRLTEMPEKRNPLIKKIFKRAFNFVNLRAKQRPRTIKNTVEQKIKFTGRKETDK